jgi:hypothetical protein
VLAPRFQHWRVLRVLWFALLLALAPLFVLLAPLALCCLPLWAAVLLSIGPINALARAQDRCRFCGIGLGHVPLHQESPKGVQPAPSAIVLRLRPRLPLRRIPSTRH